MSARTVTHDGLTLTISEWAKRTNQTPFTLRYRLDAGWPIEQALHQPLHSNGRKRVKIISLQRKEPSASTPTPSKSGVSLTSW
jgi:hypothetical protein